jgi:hypothetical protein
MIERLCTTYGIRTRDSSVKGRRLNPLTNAALRLKDGKDKAMPHAIQNFLKKNLSAPCHSPRLCIDAEEGLGPGSIHPAAQRQKYSDYVIHNS